MHKSGTVELRSKGGKDFRPVEAGAEISFGDTLQTAKDAKAQLLFQRGQTLLLKESTSLTLRGKPDQIVAHIPAGEFLIGFKKRLTRGQSFRVKTPAAVAAARGTLFWGRSDEELNSTYACLQHAIEIRAGGRAVALKQGEKVFIPYGKAPQKKEKSDIGPDFLDTFAVDGSLQGLKDLLPGK